MIIKRISGDHFVGHETFELDFPERGIVLVTGPNGSGKSSFVEAAPVAIFGKTLRGTNPWNAKKGSVTIETEQYSIKRVRAGGRSTVDVTGGPEFDTAAKAGDWLLETFGEFETWRRTHVFSAQDADNFTAASDGERKRLLEQLLSLGYYATGHSLCLKDLRETERQMQSVEHATQLLQMKVDHALADRASISAQLADLPDAPPPQTGEGSNQERAKELEAAIRAVRLRASDSSNDTASAEAGVRVWRERLKNLQDDECYTCGQEIPKSLKETAEAEVQEARAHASAVAEREQSKRAALELEESQLRTELRELQASESEQKSAAAEYERAARIRSRMEKQLADAEAELPVAYQKLEDAEAELDALTEKLGVLRACDKALGLKGVRAHVLGKTLGGIEAVANSWLTLIAGDGLALTLSPYKEKKKGGVTDAISLEIEGAGGGFGYQASSGGERRRIDVALLLALADIAGSTADGSSDTLFLDEVFESLDLAGVHAVTEALHELAKDRCVVVISHNSDLIQNLRPTKHVALP